MTATEVVWHVQAFASGSHIVTDLTAGPWLDVLLINPADLDDDRDRFLACLALAAWLNGGPRPVWMDDLERHREHELIGADGTSITAVGPMYDAGPPNLVWQQCEDEDSRNARARLIDRLWLPTGV